MRFTMNVLLFLSTMLLNLPFASGGHPKLVFSAHWMPQAQFAGYYVAKDQGFYEQAGLDVEIIHPSAAVNAKQFLANGTADIISLFLVTAINTRQEGINLVNIAQLSQHSAIMFVSKKTSGINTLNDFEGKKVGVWMSGFKEIPMAMLEENQITVDWVPILSTINLFMMDGIDVMTVMWFNEYNQLFLSGINYDELNTFFMSDYSYNIPEDGLYVLNETAETRNDELEAFVRATLKGWEYASQNKAYTLDLVIDLMREARIPSNKTHQSWMLEKVLEMQELINKDVQPTMLHEEDFNKALHIISTQVNSDFHLEYDDFFRPVLSSTP
jgi:NitT/TauT family transport system substrate-binding protein